MITLARSSVTSPPPIIRSRSGRTELIASSVSTISMMIGRSNDRRSTFFRVDPGARPEAGDTTQHGRTGQSAGPEQLDQHVVQRLPFVLVALADKDAHQESEQE